jgi:cell division protein FtsL
VAALAVQFAVSFAGLAALNIALLFISNLCAAFIIYRAGIKQSLIHCLLLEVLAAMSAFIIMFGLPKIIGHEPPGNGMILLGISSSALYFTFSYAVSRHKDDMIVYSVLVSMLSLVCAAMIAGFAFFPGSNLVLTLISVILPLAISAVCMAHRKVVCKISNSTETLLEEQRQKLNAEYYAELEHQYDLRDIIIHDIKGHLRTIKQLSQNGENDRINSYIDSIYNSGAVKQFSSNKLANVIISRYAHLCANSEIKFNCDVRSIDFSFLSDSDLTILLDNILNGAYKSAEKSEERFIDMSIGSFNEAYVVLNVRHSVDGSPDIKNSERAARISKIIQKYGGQASFDCSDERIFEAKIMFKSSVVKNKAARIQHSHKYL